MKKKLIIIFTVLFVVLGGCYAIGNYFVNYSLSPSSNSDQRDVEDSTAIETSNIAKKTMNENYEIEKKIGEEFSKETISAKIKSSDGLNLEAKYKLNNNNHKWAILIHGYKTSNKNMMSYGVRYYDKGYNVLLPDNRASGESEGSYIGMGWLDKDDIALWVKWITKKDPNAEIILHGISLGAATTMMASGDNLPNVSGYIEDCGYTSVWDIFVSELDKRFSLPSFPVLDSASLVSKIKAGYTFKEASSINQIKKAKKPMLFIHGGKDDFVPTDMAHEVYNAAKCDKDIYIVEEAGHAEARDYDPKAYWDKVFSFIDKKIKL